MRPGPTRRSRLVRAAGGPAVTSRVTVHAARACRVVVTGRASAAAAWPSPLAWWRRLSVSRSPELGGGAGVHGRAGPAGAPGAASSSAPRAAMPAVGSPMTWWILTNMPTRPSGSPGSSHICHSGRDRSRRRRRNCSAARSRAASSPGSGSGTTCTWSARSKAGASTHSGRPSPRLGTYSSCQNRGTRCSRAAITSRTASTRTRPPGPARPPSRTASAPISCGQISSGHSMRWSSSVSLSTGHTPGSRPASGTIGGAGQDLRPARTSRSPLFPAQISATWDLGPTRTEMPFCAPPTSNRPYRSDCSRRVAPTINQFCASEAVAAGAQRCNALAQN